VEIAESDVYSRSEPPRPFETAAFAPPEPDVLDVATVRQVTTDAWKEPLVRHVAQWLRLFIEEDQVVELRALNFSTGNGPRCPRSGYFRGTSLEALADQAVLLSPDAEGVYFTLNPVDRKLLARCFERVERAVDTTQDRDILQRRWLLLDL